jgi:hypothetical protein
MWKLPAGETAQIAPGNLSKSLKIFWESLAAGDSAIRCAQTRKKREVMTFM